MALVLAILTSGDSILGYTIIDRDVDMVKSGNHAAVTVVTSASIAGALSALATSGASCEASAASVGVGGRGPEACVAVGFARNGVTSSSIKLLRSSGPIVLGGWRCIVPSSAGERICKYPALDGGATDYTFTNCDVQAIRVTDADVFTGTVICLGWRRHIWTCVGVGRGRLLIDVEERGGEDDKEVLKCRVVCI